MNYNNLNQLTKQQLIRKCLSLERRRKMGWGKYFAEVNNNVNMNIDVMGDIRDALNNEEIPIHFQMKFKELVDKYKHKYECPICLEDLNTNTMEITKCGHLFHKNCINSWKNTSDKCPNCRIKM